MNFQIGLSIKKWWWVGVFLVGAATLYSHAITTKKELAYSLDQEIDHLCLRKKELEELYEELSLCSSSRDDPAWVELVLMRDLGIVPEGYLKVHFED